MGGSRLRYNFHSDIKKQMKSRVNILHGLLELGLHEPVLFIAKDMMSSISVFADINTTKQSSCNVEVLINSVRINFLCVVTWSHDCVHLNQMLLIHYNDVIMGAIASQITSLTIVYSTVYSDADQRKHQSSASLAFVRVIHRERWIPAQMASNAENASIWWRHHASSESYTEN